MSDGRCRIAQDGVRHLGALGSGHACHRLASNLNSFAPQLPSQERPSPSFAPGKGRKLHGASQFPPHLASSCRFFCPHQFRKNAKSWSGCTQPPWSVNWIYGYQPYFSPFSASQIQEYHATCERKHKEEEMLTMKSLQGTACSDFDPDRDTDKTFGPGCEIMVVWSGNLGRWVM